MTTSMWTTRPTGHGKLYTECPLQQLLPHAAIDAMLLASANFSLLTIEHTAADGFLGGLTSLSEITGL